LYSIRRECKYIEFKYLKWLVGILRNKKPDAAKADGAEADDATNSKPKRKRKVRNIGDNIRGYTQFFKINNAS
jgi:hypothetical protein